MKALQAEHVLFHSLKHHIGTVSEFIRQNSSSPLSESLPVIRTMGASQFDMYTGSLPVPELTGQVVRMLNTQGDYSRELYSNWIADHGGYRTVMLSDGSDWTLRFAGRPDFVHIHPSRYSLHTLRIKANAMKSVMIYLLAQPGRAAAPDIEILNTLRARYLELPPLITTGNNDELLKVYRLITDAVQ